MPRRLLSIPLILCFTLLPVRSPAADSCEHLVAIGVGERAPYHWQNPSSPQPQGASVALLQQVAAELGLTVEILTADSLEQAEREAISGRVDLLIDAELRPELLAGLDFLEPPLHQAPVVAWVARERTFPFQGWEDLQGRRGVHIDPADSGNGDESLQLGSHEDFGQELRSLLEGNSDYVLFEHALGQLEVLRQGLADQVEVLMPALYTRPRYLALSHNSACNAPELRSGLTVALQGLAREDSGTLMVRNFLRQWAGQPQVD